MIDLEAIEARAKAATPGPWEAGRCIECHCGESADCWHTFELQTDITPPLGQCGPVAIASGNGDAEFIAHAREDVPTLVARLRDIEDGPPRWDAQGYPENMRAATDDWYRVKCENADLRQEVQALRRRLGDEECLCWLRGDPLPVMQQRVCVGRAPDTTEWSGSDGDDRTFCLSGGMAWCCSLCKANVRAARELLNGRMACANGCHWTPCTRAGGCDSLAGYLWDYCELRPNGPECKCNGAGWVWGHELDDATEDTIEDTMTQYRCDVCHGNCGPYPHPCVGTV